MNLWKLSPAVPPTHPKTTSTTSESVWASLLNSREGLRPREEFPQGGREGEQNDPRAKKRIAKISDDNS